MQFDKKSIVSHLLSIKKKKQFYNFHAYIQKVYRHSLRLSHYFSLSLSSRSHRNTITNTCTYTRECVQKLKYKKSLMGNIPACFLLSNPDKFYDFNSGFQAGWSSWSERLPHQNRMSFWYHSLFYGLNSLDLPYW